MTHILSIDPGKNSGIALGYYDSITPYQLLQRWQVHNGVNGFIDWWFNERPDYSVLVVEKFVLSAENDFTASLEPVEIEGALAVLLEGEEVQPVWQPRQDKGSLIGYPPEAVTKAQRQRVRFDFLDRYGLFRAGTENDDSNDAVTHSLVYLKRRRHMPTCLAFWGPRSLKAVA